MASFRSSNSNNNSDGSDNGHILYVDHQNHPAPLTECFLATASRRLSSTIDRIHRPSTIIQVDSSYCPQCLIYYDIMKAQSLGYCPDIQCKRCPLCFYILSIVPTDSGKYQYFQCTTGACDYNTKETLFGKSVAELAEKYLKVVDGSAAAASTSGSGSSSVASGSAGGGGGDRGEMTTKKQTEYYDKTSSSWETYMTAIEKFGYATSNNTGTSNTNSTTRGGLSSMLLSPSQGRGGRALNTQYETRTTKGDNINETWSVKALEKSMQEKKDNLDTSSSKNKNNIIDPPLLQHIQISDDTTAQSLSSPSPSPSPSTGLDKNLQNVSVLSLILSATATTSIRVTSMNDLNPLPIPLRTRKSRRCRAELADGKPGILLKPKLNPLEGDSSLRTGHGQWYKKDSSAIHIVPKLSIVYRNNNKFLLKINNPTLGMIQLRLLSSSHYVGEQSWYDDTLMVPHFENLLLDSKTDTRIDVRLLVNATSSDNKNNTSNSPIIRLQGGDDAFVDLGKSTQMPKEVLEWKKKEMAAAAAEEAKEQKEEKESTNMVQINLISPSPSPPSNTNDNDDDDGGVNSSNGTAWFELIVPDHLLTEDDDNDNDSDNANENDKESNHNKKCQWTAAPIAMQIQVGNKSWESSLIKTQPNLEQGSIDWVTFDILVAWPTTTTQER